MKALTVAAMVLISMPLFGEESSYITERFGSTGSFFTLLSRDCSTVFYLPKNYTLDSTLSSVNKARRVNEIGNDQSSQSFLRITIVLRPGVTEPTPSDQEELKRWATESSPNCLSSPVRFQPYPSLFVRIGTEYLFPMNIFSVRHASYSIDGALRLELETDPKAVSVEKLIHELNGFAPTLTISQFNLFAEAWAEVKINYAAIADFAIHHYTEQICYEKEECYSAFGVRLYCRKRHHCDDIPRVAHYMNNLSLTHSTALTAGGTNERKIAEATHEILSRFLMSQFSHKSRENIGNVTKVTLGEMHKQTSDSYEDSESVWRVVQSNVRGDIGIIDLGDRLANKIKEIYARKDNL